MYMPENLNSLGEGNLSLIFDCKNSFSIIPFLITAVYSCNHNSTCFITDCERVLLLQYCTSNFNLIFLLIFEQQNENKKQ